MGDRSSELVTYLPASLLRAAATHPAREVPWCDEVEGTMVMADLSGFTALSERLARLGDEGAERLTEIINSFFARMLETASRYGGDTLTFGGDAILLLFDGPGHAGRAVAASLAMLKQVERAAAVDSGEGKVKIGMSVGAHSGAFLLGTAGLTEERAHSFVLGRGAEMTALAESQADRGQLAVSARTLSLLPGDPSVTQIGDYWRIDEFAAGGVTPVAAEPVLVSDEQLLRLAPFLPPHARAAAQDGAERVQITPEHRRTVIVFVNILGLNEIIEGVDADTALEQLQSYSAMLTRLAAKHHGFVVSSDIATKGSKLVITFGAPVAHEHAPANAARFALDLNAELRRSGLDLQHRIGLNGGHVFAGEVGPSFRRQYTVMGDAVNLAARLMSAAEPGEALISRKLLDYVGPDLCARELPPITVKGKEEPVAVCVLGEDGRAGGQVRGGAAAGPRHSRLFGRRAELDLIEQAWKHAQGGQGVTILVEGEAGVGKTRLIEEALRALPDGVIVTRAACFEHLQAAPFAPWVDVLHAILGTASDQSAGDRTTTVESYLRERHPDLVEFGPLLNSLLNLALPPGPVVRSLDAGARREKLYELVAAIIAQVATDRGHIVFVEDLHWMDESSLALVDRLAKLAGGTSILFLFSARQGDFSDDLDVTKVTRVVVTELSEDQSLAMVRESLGVEGLQAEVGEAIFAKTKGNPLFLEEVIHSLEAPGVLERILGASSVTRAAELAALEIPDRVQGLLMSRIDQLPADTREVLKAGSVVGRSFDEKLLSALEDPLLASVSLKRTFDELIEASLVVPEGGSRGAPVAFRHALVQDVAYESLPFSRRRELHGRIARYLETAQTTPDHTLLVHHFRNAGDAEKTRLHAVRASERSASMYAGLEAVDYLAVALATVGGRTARDACLRSRLEELMGENYHMLSRPTDAIDCYSRARRRWSSLSARKVAKEVLDELAPIDDVDGRASLLCWRIAISLERGLSAYRRSLRWFEMASAALPPDRTALAARILYGKAGSLYRIGRFKEAMEVGREGVDLSRQVQDPSLQAYALTALGTAYSGAGMLEQSDKCYGEAVELFEQAGDLLGLAVGHTNLGYIRQMLGDPRAALEQLELALGLYARVGYMTGVAQQHMNLGGMLTETGQTDAGIEHFREVLRLRERHTLPLHIVGYTLVFLSRALSMNGDLDGAEQSFAEGRDILESLNSEECDLELGVQEANLALARGDNERAESSCRRVIDKARSVGAEAEEVEALCVLGRVKLAQGEPEEAIPGLQACVTLAEKVGLDLERAQALAALAEAHAACSEGDPACEDLLSEAIRAFETMGAGYDLSKALELRERLAART